MYNGMRALLQSQAEPSWVRLASVLGQPSVNPLSCILPGNFCQCKWPQYPKSHMDFLALMSSYSDPYAWTHRKGWDHTAESQTSEVFSPVIVQTKIEGETKGSDLLSDSIIQLCRIFDEVWWHVLPHVQTKSDGSVNERVWSMTMGTLQQTGTY